MDNQQEDELIHYGVLGMKWGVTRARFKERASNRLNKRIKKYEVKAAKFEKKSEKIHAEQDLGSSNKAAVKAANYRKKSATQTLKATKADNDFTKSVYEKRATKNDLKANQLSKTTGYGLEAMKYSVKSDKAKIKAEKAKLRLASNQAYIAKMNSKLSDMSKEDRDRVQAYIDKYLK